MDIGNNSPAIIDLPHVIRNHVDIGGVHMDLEDELGKKVYFLVSPSRLRRENQFFYDGW